MQSVENAWRACSGCAGDYEDPDLTAWEPDPEEREEDTPTWQFPTKKRPTVPGEDGAPQRE